METTKTIARRSPAVGGTAVGGTAVGGTAVSGRTAVRPGGLCATRDARSARIASNPSSRGTALPAPELVLTA